MASDVLYIKGTAASPTLTKASGDVVADKSLYAELVKIPDWRSTLSSNETSEKFLKVLALTGDAQLWTNVKNKKVRWEELEELRQAQRNTVVESEMSDTPKLEKAKKVASKKAAPAPAPAPPVVANAPSVVANGTPVDTHITPPDLEAPEDAESSLKFCPVCENYLYMEVDAESKELVRLCRKCGHNETDTKGGLVMEMMIQQRSSEGYKILLNEFTRKDPRLPHIRKNISCPNVTCDSNKGGKEPDVIYIKYDLVNLMYLYICDICGEKWHSRARN